jgi:hypothetical protein
VYDTMNTFRGIVAIVPGGSLALWSGFIFDVSKLPNAIAAEKLVMFMGDDRDGIPKSLYNAAYGPWRRLLETYVQWMETEKSMAGGKISVVLGDKAGQQFQDPLTGETISAEVATQRQASQWGNSGVLVLMNGAVPAVHYPGGDSLDGFIESSREFKREIWTALTANDKTSMEGEHGSGLSQDNSADQAQGVIEMLKSKLCIALDGLSFNLLKLARGEEYAMRYCPSASMKKGDAVDFPTAGATWAAIATAEGYTPSQIPEFCKLIGVKAPNEEEMAVIGATWLATQDQKANPPEPVVAGGAPKAKPAVKK